MDTTDSKITFNNEGMCDHCQHFYGNIKPKWIVNEKSKEKLENIVAKIKKKNKKRKYDCIIGLSGGMDSTYLLYYAKEVLGLRPLVFAVDTGWNLPVADKNIDNLLKGLNLEKIDYKIDKEEMRDLQLAFFKSQVPYQDMPQDHVIFASLYNFAVKSKIKYILTGGNLSTESMREPNEWVYMNDLRMMKDIYKKFSKKKKIKKLPTASIFKYKIYYKYFKGMKVYRPLDLIPYSKQIALDTLTEKFSYEPYANKHYESRLTRFYEGYWLYHKFGYDKRKAYFSSLIVSNQMTREEALETLKKPPYDEKEALEDMRIIVEKLGITVEEFKIMMKEPNKTYKDYKNSFWLIKFGVWISKKLGLSKMQYR
jgi:N-acetyl sugar amidotransferase